MSEIKITPSTIIDLADMAEQLQASRVHWGIIRQAHSDGQTWTLRQAGEVIGVAGLWPIGPGQAEAWFHFRPAAARNMLGIVRAIRLTMDRSPYSAIVTLAKSEAGRRTARAAGFAFAGHSDFGEVWAYGHPGRGPREAADGKPAAHQPGAAGSTASQH